MAFGLYDIQEKHILEHGYGTVRGAFNAKDVYVNSNNIYVFEYRSGVVVAGTKSFNEKYLPNIQNELKSRGIK